TAPPTTTLPTTTAAPTPAAVVLAAPTTFTPVVTTAPRASTTIAVTTSVPPTTVRPSTITSTTTTVPGGPSIAAVTRQKGSDAGPPGVGLRLEGENYPCSEVAVHFDGSRIGVVEAPSGAFRATDLMVPGN